MKPHSFYLRFFLPLCFLANLVALRSQELIYPYGSYFTNRVLPVSNGFVFMGMNNPGYYGESINLLKTNRNGQRQWITNIPVAELGFLYYQSWGGILESSGNIILANLAFRTLDQAHRLVIHKVSAGGVLQATTQVSLHLPFDQGYGVTDLIRTPDGGYLVAGFSGIPLPGYMDAWLARVDMNGNLAWVKQADELPMRGAWSLLSAASTQLGGFYVAGDMTVLHIDDRGNVLSKCGYSLPAAPLVSPYSGGYRERFVPLNDGSGFSIIGTAFNETAGIWALAFAKMDWDLGVLAVQKLAETTRPNRETVEFSGAINPPAGGGAQGDFLFGYAYTDFRPATVRTQFRGFKISPNGFVSSRGNIFRATTYVPFSDLVSANAKFVFGGTVGRQLRFYTRFSNLLTLTPLAPEPTDRADDEAPVAMTALTMPDGHVVHLPSLIAARFSPGKAAFFAAKAAASAPFEAALSPNPTEGVFKISFPENSVPLAGATVQVIASTGQLILEQNKLIDSDWLDLSACSKGVYVVKITDGKRVWTGRLVKL